MSSEMRELISKEVEQWVGITRNRDIERSARVWMEGYDAAMTYCADRISALLARTEAGADLRGGNVRFDVRLKNVEAGADGAVAAKWKRLEFDRFGGRAKFDVGGVSLVLSHGEACIVDGILARFIADLTNPQDASGDAELLDWLDRQAADGVHVEVCCTGNFDARTIARKATVYVGRPQSEHEAASVRDAIRNAMQAKEAK